MKVHTIVFISYVSLIRLCIVNTYDKIVLKIFSTTKCGWNLSQKCLTKTNSSYHGQASTHGRDANSNYIHYNSL